MKKLLPLLIAIVLFGVVFALNQAQRPQEVVVAAVDLPQGAMLDESVLTLRSIPRSLAPEEAFTDVNALIGQRLRVERSAGDVILPSHLGGEVLELAADERAIAIPVTDASGVAGWLKPGDRVGLVAILSIGSGETYSKYIAGGLRVLWVSPEFQQSPPPAAASADNVSVFGGSAASAPISVGAGGLVVLAVPVQAKTVAYDFVHFNTDSQTLPVYLVDLLPALTAQGVTFGLILEPPNASEIVTSGLALRSLAITPGPTITPTLTPTATPRPKEPKE